jgi:MFS family permease
VPASGFLARGLAPIAPAGIEGWRWMFVIGALGAVVVAFLRRSLPESPRWLVANGRGDEADAVVRRFETEVAPTELPEPDAVHAAPPRDPGSFRELLVPPFRRRTGMMAVFHLLQSFGYYGFGTLVPLVLVAKGFPVVQSLGFVALTFIGYPIGSLLSLPLVERVERKNLLVVSGLGMAVFGLLFGLSDAPVAIVIFGFLYTVISNVFSNAFHIYQAEIFPTRLRATASGSTYALSRLSNALLPFILLPVLAAFGPVAMFGVVSAAMVIVALDIGLLGPRSTGRDLESVNIEATGRAQWAAGAGLRNSRVASTRPEPSGSSSASSALPIWASTERYFRPARRSASLRSRTISGNAFQRTGVEKAGRVDQLNAERTGHPELQLQQVARGGPTDGVVEEQHTRVGSLAVAALVRTQRRHRAVQDDGRGEPLAAGEHVADLRDPQPFGAQHGVGLEHLDAHALRHRRPYALQQQGHAVAPPGGLGRVVACDLLLRGAVDDVAQRVPQGRLVHVVEPDAQGTAGRTSRRGRRAARRAAARAGASAAPGRPCRRGA